MRANFLTLFLLFSVTLFAQDIIVQNNGNTILSKVIEIGSTEVKYKKFSNLNGPTYTIAKAEILVINYENGEKESFSNAQSSGSVVNSNNIGKRILSDSELLKVDINNNMNPTKVKKLRRNGWIGVVSVVVGIGLVSLDIYNGIDEIAPYDGEGIGYLIGTPLIVGGTIYSYVNFAKAYRLQKEIDSYVHSTPIFQENIEFGNGSTLSAGVDIIKGNYLDYTPGLGLRYNF